MGGGWRCGWNFVPKPVTMRRPMDISWRRAGGRHIQASFRRNICAGWTRRCAGYCPARDGGYPGSWGEIASIYLLPDFWGCGLGGWLLECTEGKLKEEGFSVGYLWVLEENLRARRAYEKAGYTLSSASKTMELCGAKLCEMRYDKGLLRR